MGRLKVKEGDCVSSRTFFLGVTTSMPSKLSGSVLIDYLEEYQLYRETWKLLIYGQVGCRGG